MKKLPRRSKKKSRLKEFKIKDDYSNITRKEMAIIAQKVCGKYVHPNRNTKAKMKAIIEGAKLTIKAGKIL